MVTCVVPGCDSSKNNTPQKYTFHIFPKNNDEREKWLRMLNRGKWVPKKNSTICSKHFDQKCFAHGLKRTNIRSGSIPKLFMPVVLKPKRKVSSYVYRDISPVPNTSTANAFVLDNAPTRSKMKKTIAVLKKRLVNKKKELKNVRAQRRRAITKVVNLSQVIETLESQPTLQNNVSVVMRSCSNDLLCQVRTLAKPQQAPTNSNMWIEFLPLFVAFVANSIQALRLWRFGVCGKWQACGRGIIASH